MGEPATLRSQFIPSKTTPQLVIVITVLAGAIPFKYFNGLRQRFPYYNKLPMEKPYEHIINFDALMQEMLPYAYKLMHNFSFIPCIQPLSYHELSYVNHILDLD